MHTTLQIGNFLHVKPMTNRSRRINYCSKQQRLKPFALKVKHCQQAFLVYLKVLINSRKIYKNTLLIMPFHLSNVAASETGEYKEFRIFQLFSLIYILLYFFIDYVIKQYPLDFLISYEEQGMLLIRSTGISILNLNCFIFMYQMQHQFLMVYALFFELSVYNPQ